MIPEDRRRQRSQDPLVALHYQLARARQEGSLDAIVVAEESGVVVAGAGAWAVCEELAAYAPILVEGGWREPGLGRASRVLEIGAEVEVHPVALEAAGQKVLLCARGSKRSGTDQTMAMTMTRAAEGVARILAA
jgi:hypothetical protein